MKLGVLWGLIGLLYSLPLSLGEHSNVHHDAVHPEAFGYPASQVVFAQGAPKRVAIIGAGASGSAAAFFLRRAARIAEKRAGLEEGELLGDIIVFEKDDRVGGRTTTIFPKGDNSSAPHELGASIFVAANYNLVNAAALFNLTVEDVDFGGRGVGIWDGESFVFSTSTSKSRWSGWWDTAAALWRYGPVSPYRQRGAVRGLLTRFGRLYDPTWLANRGPLDSIEAFSETVELGKDMTTVTGKEWAAGTVGVSERWWSEIMEASTRVNYASDMDEIHALGAAVSLASDDARAVKGGNWQIFHSMLQDAKADVRLGNEVTSINVEDDGRFSIKNNVTKEVFDQFFLAAPFWASPISKSLTKHFEQRIPKQGYVKLHVTFLTTRQETPDPAFFLQAADFTVPTTILTTSYTAKAEGSEMPFQSITYHGETTPGSGEWVVKIFSLKPLEDYTLTAIFGDEPTWVHRKTWLSYPKIRPISAYASVEPIPGFHYLASLEPWVSTMETQTLSAREAVARVASRWWGLGLGECTSGDSWDLTCK